MPREYYLDSNEDVYQEDSDEVLDTIFTLTHLQDDKGEYSPYYCFVEDISDNFGMDEKDIIQLARDNDYKIAKMIPSEEFSGGMMIIDKDCPIRNIVYDYKKIYGISPKIEIVEEDKIKEELKLEQQLLKSSKIKREDIENIIKKYNGEDDSRLHLFEVEDDDHDWCIKHYDDGDVDFSKLNIVEPTSDGGYIASFMLGGGLNGSGNWKDYFEDLKKLVSDFYSKLHLHFEIEEITNDILDDVWTAKCFLYPNTNIKESFKKLDDLFNNNLNEDLNEKVEKHDTLNPKLWNEDNTLKPEVEEKINLIADDFLEGLKDDDIKFNLKDIKLVGSNASYNWNPDSDLDLHLVMDTDSLECPDDLYPLLYSAYRSIWNKNHDVSFYGIPVEIYIETSDTEQLSEPTEEVTEARQQSALKSNGIYSVMHHKWIKEPVQADIPEVNQEEIDKELTKWEDRYFDLIENPSVETIEDFIEDIYDLRKTSIANDGEYGVGNLCFKEMRNLGYLDNLRDIKIKLKDKEFSLESLKEDFEKDALENIYNSSIENDGGIFHIEDGTPLSKDELRNKFSVEYIGKDWEKSLRDVDKQEVLDTLNSLQTQGLEDGAQAIGTWNDNGEDAHQSSVGLDKLFDNEDDALDFAIKHDQKAYAKYDRNGDYHQVNII